MDLTFFLARLSDVDFLSLFAFTSIVFDELVCSSCSLCRVSLPTVPFVFSFSTVYPATTMAGLHRISHCTTINQYRGNNNDDHDDDDDNNDDDDDRDNDW